MKKNIASIALWALLLYLVVGEALDFYRLYHCAKSNNVFWCKFVTEPAMPPKYAPPALLEAPAAVETDPVLEQ